MSLDSHFLTISDCQRKSCPSTVKAGVLPQKSLSFVSECFTISDWQKKVVISSLTVIFLLLSFSNFYRQSKVNIKILDNLFTVKTKVIPRQLPSQCGELVLRQLQSRIGDCLIISEWHMKVCPSAVTFSLLRTVCCTSTITFSLCAIRKFVLRRSITRCCLALFPMTITRNTYKKR